MKKLIALAVAVVTLLCCLVGCEYRKDEKTKLVELEKYSSMTIDGTSSIEVVYDYIEGEFTTYEFVIDDQEVIEKIMTEVFNMELKDYPKNQDIDFYQRWIIVHQGDIEYHINLCYNSDENSNRYLYQSHSACDIIEKYIEDNLIEQGG